MMAHGKLVRIVHGALKDAINMHGPVTNVNRLSAAKRIVGQLEAEFAREAKRGNAGQGCMEST